MNAPLKCAALIYENVLSVLLNEYYVEDTQNHKAEFEKCEIDIKKPWLKYFCQGSKKFFE